MDEVRSIKNSEFNFQAEKFSLLNKVGWKHNTRNWFSSMHFRCHRSRAPRTTRIQSFRCWCLFCMRPRFSERFEARCYPARLSIYGAESERKASSESWKKTCSNGKHSSFEANTHVKDPDCTVKDKKIGIRFIRRELRREMIFTVSFALAT